MIMNIVQRKMVWSACIMVAGILLFGLQMMRNGDLSFTVGFSAGIIGVSAAKLIQYFRISQSPLLLKNFGISHKEERAITISEKSGRFTYLLTMIVEFIAIFVLILLDQNKISAIVSYVAAIQAVVYFLTYFYLTKKY